MRDEYTRSMARARALAAETLALERTLSDLVNQAYVLTPAEIALMWGYSWNIVAELELKEEELLE